MKYFLALLLFSLSPSAHAAYDRVVLDRREGDETIIVTPDTLYAAAGDRFDLVLDWPGLRRWTRVEHPREIVWGIKDREKAIQGLLELAGRNHEVRAHIVSEKTLNHHWRFPGCRRNIYQTCEEQGIPGLPEETVWDEVTIQLGPVTIHSFRLVSRTRP